MVQLSVIGQNKNIMLVMYWFHQYFSIPLSLSNFNLAKKYQWLLTARINILAQYWYHLIPVSYKIGTVSVSYNIHNVSSTQYRLVLTKPLQTEREGGDGAVQVVPYYGGEAATQ